MNRPLSAQAVFHGLEMLLDLRWVAGMAGAEGVIGFQPGEDVFVFGEVFLARFFDQLARGLARLFLDGV